MAKFQTNTVKRLEKLSPSDQEDLVFDLVNAFSIMKSPIDSAVLLQDLLTENEIRNLSKRLRIAKLILSGKTQDEITRDLHCSFGTVVKISTWLNHGGEGFKKVIRMLPERKKGYLPRRSPGIGYGLDQILLYYIAAHRKNKEGQLLKGFSEKIKTKTSTDKDLREELSLHYRNRK